MPIDIYIPPSQYCLNVESRKIPYQPLEEKGFACKTRFQLPGPVNGKEEVVNYDQYQGVCPRTDDLGENPLYTVAYFVDQDGKIIHIVLDTPCVEEGYNTPYITESGSIGFR